MLGPNRSGYGAEGFHTWSTLIPNDFVLPRESRQVPRHIFPSGVSVYHSSSSIVSRRHPCSTARSFTHTARSLAFQMLEHPVTNMTTSIVPVISWIAAGRVHRSEYLERFFKTSPSWQQQVKSSSGFAAHHFSDNGTNSMMAKSWQPLSFRSVHVCPLL